MGKSPERTFRLGNISASVFANEGNEKGTVFHTVAVQRSYRDGDKTKYETSFTARDIPATIRCLELAQTYVERKDVLG
jgi:hypothetical protein